MSQLFIGLVTAFSWNVPNAVNQHVADLARELRKRGHCPVVLVSSDALDEQERMRALFHHGRLRVAGVLAEYRHGAEPDPELLPLPNSGPLRPEDGVPVIPLGASFPIRLSGNVANLGLPVDLTSRVEKLIVSSDFHVLHVHEPLAPSLSFTALREARSPVVGTFHLTPVAVATYELGQAILERFFLRLDARVVTFPGGSDFLQELFPGSYRVVPCGTTLGAMLAEKGNSPGVGEQSKRTGERFALYVYRGDGRRSFRALVRSLTSAFPLEVDRLVVAVHRASVARWVPRPVPRRLASRVSVVEFDEATELAPLYQAASVCILPYLGGEWLCATAAEAIACGCPFVGPDLPPVRDFVQPWTARDGSAGVDFFVGAQESDVSWSFGAVFSPSESGSLRKAVQQVLARKGPIVPVDSARMHSAGAVTEQLLEVYEQTIASTVGSRGRTARTPVAGRSLHVRTGVDGETRRREGRAESGARRPDWITADLHVHTEFSKDCVTPVRAIIETAREIGLGALAIADHNEIQGALLAQELAQGDPFIIVAEEIDTREGEVIGLFLQKAIPPRLGFDETLSLIKEQGGLVYVPHPFDALRTTPSYRALVDNLHRIDVIEVYNAKVALSAFNLSAERFAAKYNLVAGAGSDAHVLQGLGTAMLRMPRFHDPESFMAALWEADVVARRKNLLYLQSLKLLHTTLDRILPED